MHTITINNAMYDTGHLHVSSLTCSECGHCQIYKINFRLHLVMASVKSVYWAKNKLKSANTTKTYLKM